MKKLRSVFISFGSVNISLTIWDFYCTQQSLILFDFDKDFDISKVETTKGMKISLSFWKNIVLLNVPTGAGKRNSTIMNERLISDLIVDAEQIKSLTPNSIITLN